VFGRVHLLLARWLYLRGPAQARLEYRLAYAQDQGTRFMVVAEAPRLVRSYDEAMELVPEGIAGTGMLEALATALADRLPATRVRLDAELLARDPRAIEPARRAAEDAVHDVRAGESAPWCAARAKECYDEALAKAVQLRDRRTDVCEGHALLAELKIANGEADRALDELERGAEGVEDRSACLRKLVQLAARAKREVRVDMALEKLARAGCVSDADCVASLIFAGDVEEARGRTRRSLSYYKKAWERDPSRLDLLEIVAAKSERLGLHAEALDAYQKLAEKFPDEPKWKAGVARETASVRRSALSPP
jgi:tetratricopeptide (TPR) repeat protein